ncbi:hypothetical protein FACS189421_09840 [Bacteroidia bacterium]|nr:hypothetical protein FACS189421_09840 [Bacteroidia bacterium]
MKRYYFLFLAVAGLLAGLNVNAQDAPVAGQKFRIVNEAGVYLTYTNADTSNPLSEWNNRVYVDSLYTVVTDELWIPPFADRAANEDEYIQLSYNPDENQVFTLINPNPNDPEIWAIEAYDGLYLAAHTSNSWDMGAAASPDVNTAQFFFKDPGGWDLYTLSLVATPTQFLAPDNLNAGFKINRWDSGWEHADRSFVYRDKGAEKGIWYFESAGTTGIKNVKSVKDLAVSVRDNVLSINKANGTLVSIYNITGAKVIETPLQGNLNVGNLPAGVYVIATADGERAKFIKK